MSLVQITYYVFMFVPAFNPLGITIVLGPPHDPFSLSLHL